MSFQVNPVHWNLRRRGMGTGSPLADRAQEEATTGTVQADKNSAKIFNILPKDKYELV